MMNEPSEVPTCPKMGYEPNENHVERKFGNVPVTLEFDLGTRTITFRSKLESRYANYLERLREIGEVLGWWYEQVLPLPSHQDPDHWKPDFLVLRPGLHLEIHECKGIVEQDDVHKLKWTQTDYPSIPLFLIFAKQSKDKPQVKARASQWATILYADVLFKQMFGSSKAGVP